MTFEEYAAFVAPYTLEKTAEMTGVEASRLQALAELYADPNVKVMSLWTMGFNQHTRGTWANNLVYNLHLLTGKIAEPGNSPFSLTGQPSACGTAREVGTFAHRLPADLQVTNPEHRAHAEELWKLPPGTIPDWIGSHAVQQNRDLKDGKINVYWVQVNNNIQAAAEPDGGGAARLPQPGELHRRLGRLSDRDLRGRRPDPAGGDVGREGGRLRQRRAAHPVLAPAWSTRRARRSSDLWQLVEFSKRFTVEEVWPPELITPELAGKTLFDVLFANGQVDAFQRAEVDLEYANAESDAFGFYIQKGLFEEYATFGRGHGHDLAPFDRYHEVRGLRWPVVEGQETRWRFNRDYDPYAEGEKAVQLLRPQGRPRGDLRAALRAAGREPGRGVSVLALHRPRARALALRLDDPAGARALPRRARRGLLHAPRRRRRRSTCAAARRSRSSRAAARC